MLSLMMVEQSDSHALLELSTERIKEATHLENRKIWKVGVEGVAVSRFRSSSCALRAVRPIRYLS